MPGSLWIDTSWYIEPGRLFQAYPECSSSKNPGLHPLYPMGQCLQPLHPAQDPWARPLSISENHWVILFPSCGPFVSLHGPLNTCSPSFGGVALGFNWCYSGNPKVKTSSIAEQNIQTIFPRFVNRNFWWESIERISFYREVSHSNKEVLKICFA